MTRWLEGQANRYFVIKDGSVVTYAGLLAINLPQEEILASFDNKEKACESSGKYRAAIRKSAMGEGE